MSERGFALTELLIAISVGMVVVVAAFAALDRSVAGSSEVGDRIETSQRSRTAMEDVTRQLRSQVCPDPGRAPIVDARPNSVTFYAHLGNESFEPDMRRVSLTGDALVQDVYAGSGTGAGRAFASSPTTTKTLLTEVVPPASGAVFRYYTFGGADPVRPASQELVPGADGLSATDRARVVRIVVGFVARPTRRPGSSSGRTTMQNEVFARTADPLTPGAGPRCI